MRLTARVVADVGEEVDAAAQPAQPDRDVERAAADVLAESPGPSRFDDVDQRLADDRARGFMSCSSRVRSRSDVSSVARAPSRCSESSAHR